MGLDWALIEYRPGRYAKVSSDGTFLGTATEAEVRAWFSASAPASSREDPSHGQDAGPAATPGAPGAAESSREPEVPWEEPLIWAPPRPGPARPAARDPRIKKARPEPDESWAKPTLWAPPATSPDADADAAVAAASDREVKDHQPEPDESWAEPTLWAPPRAGHEGDDPPSQESRRQAPDTQPEPDEAWARPMLWGRPPASPQAREQETCAAETDTETTTPSVEAPGASPPEPALPLADQPEAMPEGSEQVSERPPPSAPRASEQVVEAGDSLSQPASLTVTACEDRAEAGEEAQAATRPVLPGLEGLRPRKESEDLKQGPTIPGPAAEAEAVQVAMDLANLEPIVPDSLKAPSERAPVRAGAEVAPSEPSAPDALEPGPEPEETDGVEAEPGLQPPLDRAKGQDTSPEATELDAEESEAEPEDGEEGQAQSEPEPLPVEEAPLAPEVEALLPEEEEEWLEVEPLEEEVGVAPEEAEGEDDDPGLGGLAAMSPSASRPASADLSRDSGASDQSPLDLETEVTEAEDLWLWVDPRYEGGYSPATFDLAAFLQRAIALFQSKAWSGGQPPGRIAVHASQADADLGSVAERLELTVIEDARVSGGTYWLGLSSDGGPDEHD